MKKQESTIRNRTIKVGRHVEKQVKAMLKTKSQREIASKTSIPLYTIWSIANGKYVVTEGKPASKPDKNVFCWGEYPDGVI